MSNASTSAKRPPARPVLRPVVLGIESSCDETAVALVTADRTILSERIASQQAEHAPYGGVVPEIAARARVEIANSVDKYMTAFRESKELVARRPPKRGGAAQARTLIRWAYGQLTTLAVGTIRRPVPQHRPSLKPPSW